MAFIEPTEQDRVNAQSRQLPHALESQLKVRTAAIAKISELADARFQSTPGDPPLWETTFAAVAHYRKHRKVSRDWIEATAGAVIKAGAPSGPTCDRFGIGRATMQQVMAGHESLAMLTDVKPKPKKGESDGAAA